MKTRSSLVGAVLFGAALVFSLSACSSAPSVSSIPPRNAVVTPAPSLPEVVPITVSTGSDMDGPRAIASVGGAPSGDFGSKDSSSTAANGTGSTDRKKKRAIAKPPAPGIGVTQNPNIAEGSNFSQVRVFYGTDRKPVGADNFGPFRTDPRQISYGNVIVSIPRKHQLGAVERPSIWHLEFQEHPENHMVVMRRNSRTADQFWADVHNLLAREGTSNSSFIFVHGYNVSFDDAARRTAQITFDLKYTGVPVFYSWPSEGAVENYTADWSNSAWAALNLKRFLIDYAEKSSVANIHLVAHSMGNRALTHALKDLFTERVDLRGRFKTIILAAPDVDASEFVDEFAPAMVRGCQNITLYVSDGDVALLASKKAHGGYIRVGDARVRIVVTPGIETVDASGLDTSFLEHSYFAEDKDVLGDIKKLVLQGLRAAGRGLLQLPAPDGATYWKISPPGSTPP